MAKMLIIKTCNACGDVDIHLSADFCYGVEPTRAIQRDGDSTPIRPNAIPIPDWCPLPDAEGVDDRTYATLSRIGDTQTVNVYSTKELRVEGGEGDIASYEVGTPDAEEDDTCDCPVSGFTVTHKADCIHGQ